MYFTVVYVILFIHGFYKPLLIWKDSLCMSVHMKLAFDKFGTVIITFTIQPKNYLLYFKMKTSIDILERILTWHQEAESVV